MAERPTADRDPGVDPTETPFELPPVEGLPYESGSEEERAIRSVIDEADRERAHAAADVLR